MNQLDYLIRQHQAADYPEEPETKYPLWFLGYGWPAIFILAIGISGAAFVLWFS